jgi:hypothetical protein
MNRTARHCRAVLFGSDDLRLFDMRFEGGEHMAIDITLERYRQINQPVW